MNDNMITSKDFLGKVENGLGDSMQEWLSYARSIREALDKEKKAFIFTEYLSRMLELVETLSATNAVEAGHYAGDALHTICTDIINGDGSEKDHPFFATAAKYIYGHQLPIDSTSVQASLYYSRLSSEFVKRECQSYCDGVLAQFQEIYSDTIIKEHYDRICALLGDSLLMDSLNKAFRHRFILEPISSLFYQGEARFMASLLLVEDTDARRIVLMHLLDEMLPPFTG